MGTIPSRWPSPQHLAAKFRSGWFDADELRHIGELPHKLRFEYFRCKRKRWQVVAAFWVVKFVVLWLLNGSWVRTFMCARVFVSFSGNGGGTERTGGVQRGQKHVGLGGAWTMIPDSWLSSLWDSVASDVHSFCHALFNYRQTESIQSRSWV